MSLRKILYGLEHILEGLLCDHVVTTVSWTEDKKLKCSFYVRRWHPAHWVGYVRCVWLGDLCGSAYYNERYKELE